MTNTNVNIYIDCTETYRSKLNTGIQRVVKNIISNSSKIQIKNYNCIPVVYVYGKFYEVSYDFENKLLISKYLTVILAAIRNILDKVCLFNKSVSGESEIKNKGTDSINRHHQDLISICRKLIPIMYGITFKLDQLISPVREVTFKNDDVLFLADAFWKCFLYKALRDTKNLKLIKILMVYDVIPLSHPDLADDMNCVDFKEYFNKFLCEVDGVMSISKSSLEQVKKYSVNNKLKYNFFYLGADFKTKLSNNVDIRSEIESIYYTNNTYLVVGTIEPRKNYNFIIDAFELLWQEGHDIKLCLVGKVGWKCDDVISRVKERIRSGNIYYFSDLNDDELEICYQKAKALVFASIVEGFGLPLVEAMHQGIPVIASDIPVFREVGGDYPIYFDIKNPTFLSNAISDFESGKFTNDFVPKNWFSWEESIQDMFDKLIGMVDEIKLRHKRT